jgi:hypothetical protein
MGEYEVSYNAANNRVYLKLTGFLNMEEAQGAVGRIKASMGKVGPGFTLLNDMLEFKPAAADVQVAIGEAMKIVSAKKPAKVARVATAVAGMQFGRIGKEQAGYEVGTFKTVAEAEAFLDE